MWHKAETLENDRHAAVYNVPWPADLPQNWIITHAGDIKQNVTITEGRTNLMAFAVVLLSGFEDSCKHEQWYYVIPRTQCFHVKAGFSKSTVLEAITGKLEILKLQFCDCDIEKTKLANTRTVFEPYYFHNDFYNMVHISPANECEHMWISPNSFNSLPPNPFTHDCVCIRGMLVVSKLSGWIGGTTSPLTGLKTGSVDRGQEISRFLDMLRSSLVDFWMALWWTSWMLEDRDVVNLYPSMFWCVIKA